MTRTILIKGKAGLGNRILATLTGMVFGLLCERRILVDWRDGAYAAPTVNAFPRLFASPIVPEDEIDLAQSNTVAPLVWRGHVNDQVADMIARFDPRRFGDPTIYRKYCCDLSTLTHPEDTIVYFSHLPKFQRIRRHFRGELAQYRNASEVQIIHDLMSRWLPLHQRVSNEIDTFVADNFSSPIIGVHVRYSDMRSPVDSIQRAVDRFLTQEPAARIFLATDNRAVEDDFDQKYPHVLVTPKWLPSPGEQLHYNAENVDPEASAIEALKDIYLLSRAKYLVYPGRSTFSYLSRCLGGFPDNRVCDVERYSIGVRLRRLVHNLV
jgi:hypothetical protein